MKFAHTLILNAVPEWVDQYVDYDHLKKLVYRIERVNVQRMLDRQPSMNHSMEEGSVEKPLIFPSSIAAGQNQQQQYSSRRVSIAPTFSTALDEEEQGERHNADDQQFIEECDKQLDKVCKFYEQKETEVFEEAKTLRAQFDEFNVSLPDDTLNHELTWSSANSEHKLEKLDTLLAGYTTAPLELLPSSSMTSVTKVNGTSKEIEENDSNEKYQHFNEPMSRLSAANIASPSASSRTNSSPPPEVPHRRHSTSNIQSGSQSENEIPFVFSSTETQPGGSYIPVDNNLGRRNTVGAPTFTHSYEQHDSNWLRGLRFLQHTGSNAELTRRMTEVKEFNKYYNFRARCTSIYILLSELKSYIHLNHEAFQKITKKWDKVAGSNLRTVYCNNMVDKARPFQPARVQEIETAMKLIEYMYAAVFTGNDITSAVSELKLHMRDHIHYERNTVWKDMVGKEREAYDAHAVEPQPGYNIPYINIFLSRTNLRRIITLLFSVIVYALLMSFDTMNDKSASKCLALLIFAALMWAFETLPLFATAYLIALLIVPMDIIKETDGNNLMSAKDASKAVFSSMFNGTISVLLGGFAIAAALSRHGVTKAFAGAILSKAGTRPHWVILVNMYLAAFLCMWISNVATPVLCFSLVQPILRTLPPNSKVGPCLIMGIALASCIGGLSSPIASPQNIIAIQLLEPNPGWGIWFAVALPLTIICIMTTWGMLLIYFRPTRSTPRINAIKSTGFACPSYSQIWVVFVCLLTIALWCGETAMESFWGDNGVIALIPFVLLFGTNMLNKTDLNNFLWTVVTLAQGGMALGFAVNSSGLLDIIGHRIADGVEEMSVLAILFIFGILVLVFATFVSHTVAALIILPIVKQVGEHLPVPHPDLLIIVTCLTASIAMGLPVSGFPNMNAIMQEDPTGKPYLSMKDFVLCGVPASIIAGLITILLGYGILSGVGY